MSSTRYLPDSTAPWLPVGVLAVMVIAGGWIMASQIAGRPGPGVPFMLLWFVVLLWNCYFWLFRTAYKVEIRDSELLWFTPFRRGGFPVTELRSITRTAMSKQLVRLTRTDGSSVIIRNHREFPKLVADVMSLNPHVDLGDVSVGILNRSAGSLSAYTVLSD
jgi:1-acyl-sn-glycerol-3-phosphate acyltransferase